MVMKKVDLCRKYRIATYTLDNFIRSLPAEYQVQFDLNGKKYYNKKQLELFKQLFGDWNRYPFKTKSQLCIEYEVSMATFRKMLLECFGRDNEILKGKKLFTSKQVECIYNVL